MYNAFFLIHKIRITDFCNKWTIFYCLNFPRRGKNIKIVNFPSLTMSQGNLPRRLGWYYRVKTAFLSRYLKTKIQYNVLEFVFLILLYLLIQKFYLFLQTSAFHVFFITNLKSNHNIFLSYLLQILDYILNVNE